MGRARRSTQRPSHCWLRCGCPVSGRAPFAILEPHVQTGELKGCRGKPAVVAKSRFWAPVIPLARVLEKGLCTPRLGLYIVHSLAALLSGKMRSTCRVPVAF